MRHTEHPQRIPCGVVRIPRSIAERALVRHSRIVELELDDQPDENHFIDVSALLTVEGINLLSFSL